MLRKACTRMKLFIQIPCHNEEASLPIALAALPRELAGVSSIETLVIDDGSKDRTVAVARELGVTHVVGFPRNQGLAKAFMLGIRSCLERGADIIVNTDADNQYDARDIPALIQPILDGRAEIVVGARPIATVQHFSPVKKLLQRIGSNVVARVSGTRVADAPSGFRAFSRDAASRLNVFSDYTYTLETIIQAGQKNMSIVSVPVRVNADLRPSRLVRSIFSYVRRSMITILRILIIYRPVLSILRILIIYRPVLFFLSVGSFLFVAGAGLGVRFLYLRYWAEIGTGHVQSLILAAVLMIFGFQTGLLAFIADLLSVNRRLLEELLEAKRVSRRDHHD
jgi:glycosyltransferase involved in cell wall biosynthesis